MARKLGMYAGAAVLVAALLVPDGAAAAGPRGPAATACKHWVQTKSPNTGTGDNNLYGVAATSARNAWAVGESFFGVNTKIPGRALERQVLASRQEPEQGHGRLASESVYAVSADQRLGGRQLLQRHGRADAHRALERQVLVGRPEPEPRTQVERDHLDPRHLGARHLGRGRRRHQLPGDQDRPPALERPALADRPEPERAGRAEPPYRRPAAVSRARLGGRPPGQGHDATRR